MKGALLCSLLASTATAHMQMMKPYPIRSPLNKDAKGQKDYSYTNPLQASGSDYPCKGYAKDDFDSQATYQQGQSYTMELDGSATHDGGSCQLALTYDQGESFKVIESMLGDCPIAKKYDFQIPSDAPDGQALLAWTWFNKVGNREMYMNCAMVTIGGNANANETDADAETQSTKHRPNKPQEKKVSHPPMALAAHQGEKASQRGAKSQKQQASFDSLPALFVANVDQEGKCVTIEGESVNFPKPGDNVVGQTDGKGDGYKCSGSAPFLDSSKDTSDSTSKDSKDTSDSTSKDNTNSKVDKSTKTSTQDKANKGSKTNADSTQTKTNTDSNKAKPTDSKDSKANSKDANKNATRSTPQSMSKVAQAFGTSGAADPRVVATDASTNNAFSSYVGGFTCTSGEIICAPDGYSWAMCSNGAPIFMGSVAAGMTCRLGAMVAAPW
ncbi:uncharacterized protein N7484_005973 [Penicillium longicatenatum]|uniref:uncharacterized protein n=1 Tax=Penicillium longicatenatum TaxID=1561947 RepID=UPI00254862A5|nr:uncharacterized protein N7484_005973 [Penicillium longicatenatum]KAJ5643466.1 hypothetical protein N7484_005973 [Penicillium longicatenatum]